MNHTGAHPLVLEFLGWVAAAPRTYAEAMEAWRTSCPRFSIWEDALACDLVCIVPQQGEPFARARVILTPLGRAILDGPARVDSPATEN